MDLLYSFAWNTTSHLNGSGNSSFQNEFPYWRIAMAERIILVIFVLFPIAIFLNITVLLTFVKTRSLRRPLNFMHIALILELFLIKYTGVTLGLPTFTVAVRYCTCLQLHSTLPLLVCISLHSQFCNS